MNRPLRSIAASALAATVIAVLGGSSGCGGGFPRQENSKQLSVTITSTNAGSPTNRLPISFTQTQTFTVHIEARNEDGSINTSYNSFVRASVTPGEVTTVTGPGAEGRNVQLTNGVADGIQVSVLASFGDAHIWFEDLGYIPADPLGQPPPECSNGIDDNHNGLIDYPADPGCYAANDNTEDGGTYAAGVTAPIYFTIPRIADVRGVSQGGTATTFPNEQVTMDTGFDPDTVSYRFNTVISDISSTGFFVTDTGDSRGFSSVFAYTFNAPPDLRVCDRLKQFAGTSSDFYGFTEINYPTWLHEPWDPNGLNGGVARPCLVPEPHVLTLPEIENTNDQLFDLESSLVRVLATGNVTVHMGQHFGPNLPGQDATGAYTVIGPNASNCDILNTGKVDFNNDPDKSCATACTADPECTEFTNYLSENQFALVVVDSTQPTAPAKANAKGNAAPGFNPFVLKNQGPCVVVPGTATCTKDSDCPNTPVGVCNIPTGAQQGTCESKTCGYIKSFTGSVTYFSGGNQFTVEARCVDDIVLDSTTPDANLPTSTTGGTLSTCVYDRDCPLDANLKPIQGACRNGSCSNVGACVPLRTPLDYASEGSQ
jgi:hypothetical protein